MATLNEAVTEEIKKRIIFLEKRRKGLRLWQIFKKTKYRILLAGYKEHLEQFENRGRLIKAFGTTEIQFNESSLFQRRVVSVLASMGLKY